MLVSCFNRHLDLADETEFDLIAKDVRTKDYYYNEATANLNQAEEAFRASGASPEEEPVSLAMGKSELLSYLS